jgi:hypothetical protein
MPQNLATIDDFERGIRREELSSQFWQVPTTSVPAEEYDHQNLPWQIQHVVDSPYRASIVVRVKGAIPRWVVPTTDRLTHLSRLRENWDSYGASPVSTQSITLTIQVMNEIMVDRTPLPAIVPTTDGGVQLEWHFAGIDLEVEVNSNGILSVSYEDAAVDQQPWEDDFLFIPGLMLRDLKERLQIITERAA